MSDVHRQVWIGSVPVDFTEGIFLEFLRNAQLPVPWKALVRSGKSNNARQMAICTMETEEDRSLLLQAKFRFPDGMWASVKRSHV